MALRRRHHSLAPGGTCDVTTDDRLDRKDFKGAYLHAAATQKCTLLGSDDLRGCGRAHADNMVLELGNTLAEDIEPMRYRCVSL